MDRDNPSRLTVTRLQERTEALGPGLRAVVWFHGCALRCPGCIAKEMNESKENSSWCPDQLARWLLSLPEIEGVTLSGGDPFDQSPVALQQLLERIRADGRLSILCYTGRTLEQLERALPHPLRQSILDCLDVLIDGPYIEALNDGGIWRGSSNQKIHFLSPRYRHLEASVSTSTERRLEARIGASGSLELTGIPPRGFMEALHTRLSESGLQLEFDTSPPNL